MKNIINCLSIWAVTAAPFTSDQINLIIMMLSISGTALILLLIFSLLQKNKKK